MDEYLKTLLDQIRCKEAHPYIESEIRMHIEDQIETNLANGMTEAEAIAEAVRDMGSPVESGIELDKIHRPAMNWDFLFLIGGISLLAILLHWFIGDTLYPPSRFALHTSLGLGVMLIIYRLDYSFMASYAKWIAGSFIFIELLAFTTALGVRVNGANLYFSLGWIHISIFSLMMLYVPIYGALLYQYYGTGYVGLLKSILWMILPCYFSAVLSNLSLALILFYAMAVVLSIAVYKGWFVISKRKFLICFWIFLLLLPIVFVVSVFSFHWLAAYQEARLTAFFTQSGDAYYVTNLLLNHLSKSQMFGGIDTSTLRQFPEIDSGYIFTYLTASYGIVAGIFVCAIMCYLIFKIFKISFCQKNQLGMLMGAGCGTVLLVNSALNIFQNVGLLPFSCSFLPFFSSGGSCIVVSYAMLGIVLSIYRYKNIFPIHFKHSPKMKLTIKIEKTNAS